MKFNIRQTKVLNATESKILCLAAAASGKAIPIDTILPTPNGEKMASEIRIGDLLFDKEGKPTKVLGVYPQGEKEVYEITFGDGRKAKCCNEHLWQVHKNTWKNKNDFRPLSLKEILEDNLIDKSRRAKYSIPVAKAVEYKEKEYSIHPYVIGAMLGNGCCISNTRLTLSSENDEIPKHILELLNGQELYNNPANYNWQFKDKNGKYFLTEILPEEVKQLSYEKRIPKEYKYGSINQRLELVQGLMDTDGSISKDRRPDHSATASISFTSTSILLIKDLQEVLGSLGYISTIKTDERIGKYTRDKCYSLSINMPNKDKHKLFWLKRKKEIALSVQDKKQSRNYDRTSIRKIENLNYKTEMVCFMVDNPEHLYLMNDFIVTHNTRVLTERIRILIEEKGISSKDIVAITFTNMAAEEMRKRIGDSAKEAFIGTIHSYGNKVCNYNGIDTSNYLETFQFDKILKRAVQIPKSKFPKIKHLLIDECQDLSPLEYQFLMKIPTENIFFVGDNRQCQPEGTKVLLREGIVKNIEDVRIGDSVVWYDNSKSYVSGLKIKYNSIEKKVTKVASRDFCYENLITIITEKGEKTQYTPNHIGFIRIHQSEYNHAVYLMCDDNNRFRIGKIPFTCTNKSRTNPWRDKLYAEGCSKIWILKVFKTDQEARLLETKLSYRYQIPQTCWQLDKVSWSKEDIDYIYEGLDTYNSAKKCLEEFHRDIRYPLLDRTTEGSLHIHFARNAVTEIFAANIMPEVMDVLVYDSSEKHRKHYEQIVDVQYSYITQPIKVYSLEVEGSTYIADNIITHNCIYGFKGCTDEFLENMWKDEAYKKYYLTENYRNAPNIIKFADNLLLSMKQFSPAAIPMKTKMGLIVGDVNEPILFEDALEDLEDSKNWGSWFILTRTNNELAVAQNMLDERGIPNVTFKKADLDMVELEILMSVNRVKVLTIHSAKGLENKNVIVCGARRYNEEERRISYVAATRAENSLYWCAPIAKRNHKHHYLPTSAEGGKFFDKTAQEMLSFED